MNFGEFEALKKGLIKEIERSKDGHGVLMANESQEEMKAAQETVDTTSYRGLVRQKKPAIPRRWLKSAMFSLLASVMIDWRKEREDAEDKDAEAVQMDGRQVVLLIDRTPRNSTPPNAATSTEASVATETSGQGKRKAFGAAVKVEGSQAAQRAEVAKKAQYDVQQEARERGNNVIDLEAEYWAWLCSHVLDRLR